MSESKKESKKEKTLIERLIAFHEEMPAIYKQADNPYFKSKYATYEAIMKVCMPQLIKNGLMVSHFTFVEGEKEYIKTVICSLENERIESTSMINPMKNDIQAKGSYFTYLKRYHVTMLLGLAIFDENDDDGESLMNGVISDSQYKQLEALLKDKADLKDQILRGYGIIHLKNLPRQHFNACKNGILKKAVKREANENHQS